MVEIPRIFTLHVDESLLFIPQHNPNMKFQPLAEVYMWCEEHCKGKWRFKHIRGIPPYMVFEDEMDRLHFKLRWIG